jgi:hypothetical protein
VRTRSKANPVDDLPPIEIFGIDADGELAPLARGVVVEADVWRNLGEAAAKKAHQAGNLKARPGPRIGGSADRSDREGGREDVVMPVPMKPYEAGSALATADFFARPLPHLVVDPVSLEVDHRGYTWRAEVRCRRLAPSRPATLRVYPSPSGNLTIVELVPTRPGRIPTSSFIRAGVEALTALGLRLLESRPRTPVPASG